MLVCLSPVCLSPECASHLCVPLTCVPLACFSTLPGLNAYLMVQWSSCTCEVLLCFFTSLVEGPGS